MKVSICLPTIRPDRARRCVDRLFETTVGHDVEVVAVVEQSLATRDALAGSGAQVILRERKHSPVYGWNQAARAATGDALVEVGDDVEWGDGWLDEALNVLARLPGGQGMVGFNDLNPATDKQHFFPHYLITRKSIIEDHGGCLVVPHYNQFWLDVEAYLRAERAGRMSYAPKSIVRHIHPSSGGPTDSVYRSSQKWEPLDHEIYEWRLALNFPNDFPPQLGPQSGKPSVFWCLLRPSHEITNRRSLAIAEHCKALGYYNIDMPYARTDVTRNRLERRFRRLSTRPDDVLVLLDGDHDHPYDIVERLATEDVPVLVALCRTRTPPYNPVMLRRVDGVLQYITDWPEGQIIRADAVGTGAVAIKAHVFDQLEAAGVYAPFFRYMYKDEDEHQPSEDLYFSAGCEQAGVGMACHTGVYSDHILNALV